MENLLSWLDNFDWQELLSIPILTGTYIIKWLITFICVWYVFFISCAIYRLLKLKFGRRISPNGDLGILITGATSGFGLALSKLFYKLGFTVFAAYFNDKEFGYKELQELGSQPVDSNGKYYFKRPYIFLVRMDVRSLESIEASGKEINSLLDQYGIKLHSLINNAGIGETTPFEWCHRDTIMNMIGTNLTGTMLVTRQFLSHIVHNKGRVINVSSGTYAFPANVNNIYGSSKAAIVHFSVALNEGIKKYGASSHCIIPDNFLSVSNIIYPLIRSMQKSINGLTAEEKESYHPSIRKFETAMFSVLKKKLKKSGDDLYEMAEIFNFEVPNLEETTKEKPREARGITSMVVGYLLSLFSGSKDTTLDGSSSLNAFEQAVCLKRPPLRLYAGSPIYSYYSGVVIEFLPSVLCEKWGKYMLAHISK